MLDFNMCSQSSKFKDSIKIISDLFSDTRVKMFTRIKRASLLMNHKMFVAFDKGFNWMIICMKKHESILWLVFKVLRTTFLPMVVDFYFVLKAIVYQQEHYNNTCKDLTYNDFT